MAAPEQIARVNATKIHRAVAKANLHLSAPAGYNLVDPSPFFPLLGAAPVRGVKDHSVARLQGRNSCHRSIRRKYDPVAQSFSGNSLKIDDDVVLSAEGNVFGYADRNGIHKGGTEKLRLVGNMIFGNLGTDYWETAGDRRLELGRMEDEAEHLHDDTADNVGELVAVPVGDDYLKKWGARVLIDRNAAAADVTAERTRENAIRRVLGLPLEAKDIGLAGEVWLPRLAVDDALAVGRERLAGRYGARAPKPE